MCQCCWFTNVQLFKCNFISQLPVKYGPMLVIYEILSGEDSIYKHEAWWLIVSILTTWSFIWMHEDFFLIAATPVVKVFLMLVARRKDSWETPSRPAIDPDSTVAPPARLINNELMTFLEEIQCQHEVLWFFFFHFGKDTSLMLTSESPAGGS